jgi:hypothetical protein
MTRIIFILMTVTLMTVSCDKAASSRVKEKSVEAAKQRDVKFDNLPIVSFDKMTYDFGTIEEGESVETSFEITNSGKSDLIIKKASATCGCTVPDWPKNAIKSGETAPMKVKFNSRGKRNKISKTITLITNTASGKETVKIIGFVNPKEK